MEGVWHAWHYDKEASEHDFNDNFYLNHEKYDLRDAKYHQKGPPYDEKGAKYDLRGVKYHWISWK